MLRDPAEAPIVAECAHCRGEIYEGDEVYRIDDGGEFVHNGECATSFAFISVYDGSGVIERDLTIN